MTNTAKLQAKMKENRFTIKTLANAISLSTTGLFNKVHNHREFFASEMQKISKLLNLTNDEIQEIFFANDVEFNSTNKN